MKFKKLLVLLAGSLMSLSACATNAGGGNVDQTLPSGDPSREITINFWHCLGHAKTTQLQKVIDAFNTKYAGKYKVFLTKAAGDYGDLDDVVKQKLSAGEVPALTMGYPDSFSAYMTKKISRSKILRLNNFIEDATYGYSQAELDDFVTAYWDEGHGYQFDGVWSVPMYKSTEVMYYNKTYFYGGNDINEDKFGKGKPLHDEFDELEQKVLGFVKESATEEQIATYNANMIALKTWCQENGGKTYEIPSTWEEMITVARAIKQDREAQGIAVPGEDFFPIGYDSDSNLMITQLEQLGYEYTTNDDASKENPMLHYKFYNNNTKSLLTEITGYIRDGLLETKGSLGGQYTNTFFTAGKCIMSIGSTGGSSYQASQNFDVSIAHVPTRAGKTAKYIQQGPSICFFDNNNKWIHKGAWLFYREYLSDPVLNAKLALENSYDPIRKSSYTTTEYTSWVSNAGHGLAYDIPAITQTLKNNYMTSPVFVGSGTARDEIGNTIAYVIGSNMSIDLALQTAYNACTSNA